MDNSTKRQGKQNIISGYFVMLYEILNKKNLRCFGVRIMSGVRGKVVEVMLLDKPVVSCLFRAVLAIIKSLGRDP